MKTFNHHLFYMLLLSTAIFLMPSSAEAQNRTVKKRAKTTVQKTTTTLKAPSSPTPLDIKERTIKDLLYFPFGCLPHEVNTPKEAMEQLTETFDMCEKINGYEGLHNNSTYDFTYLGVPIGLCYASRYDDNRQWYLFYFSSHANANSFYSKIVKDIKDAGIPLIRDNIYGGMSNRTRPVSIFSWVYVNTPELVKAADESNIHHEDVVGMYVVELGVYKKHKH